MSKSKQGSLQGNGSVGHTRRQPSDNRPRHQNHYGSDNVWSNSKSNPEDEAVNKALNDRLLYLLAKSVGSTAIVTVSSGAQYRGIFSGSDTKNDLSVVLSQVEEHAGAPGEENQTDNEFYDQLIIPSKELLDIFFETPSLKPDKPTGFKTDTDISGKLELKERELQRWAPDESDSVLGSSLEDSNSGEQWDQFAVNEKKFGLQSTYDEHFYTTAIDKKHPDYIKRQKEAEKIAAEITSSSHGGNVHLAEERGIVVDDSGLDEEDKYSGVDRRTVLEKEGSSKTYTPPRLRASANSQTTKSMPDDPAIISSSLAKHPKAEGFHGDGVGASGESPKHKSPGTVSGEIENELVGNFKQFVSVEVQRVNQKKQQWQKKEKSERLHDFKKFSEDYKITAPVPPDLIPLLAKGKEKQEEILQRSNSAAASPVSVTSKVASNAPSPAKNVTEVSNGKVPSQQPSPVPPTTAVKAEKSKPKFNFNAAGFRPNTGAASFTPSFTKSSPAPASPAQLRSPPIAQQSSFSRSPSRAPSMVSTPPAADAFLGGKTIKPKNLEGKFNPFVEAQKKSTADTVYIIERAYVTPPTWHSTMDSTYGQVFASKHSDVYGGARIGGSPSLVGSQLTSMMQPSLAFDERGNPIMSTSPPPLMPGMVPGYGGQYGQYNNQYLGRGAPSFNQQMFMGYVPPAAAMAAAMAVANGVPQPYGNQQMMNVPQNGRYYGNNRRPHGSQGQNGQGRVQGGKVSSPTNANIQSVPHK